ncbi:FMN-dependent NADH-azoreductase [Aestuariibacter salexigens]|uniref:FMN-dependent NADH-azoreductase n=1 Tax=Aestuariibacter salexigens TaxID=226010 RepID=UPI000422FDAD|nr:NAD(P)H-dependent oxidoreductase [Aestuariibacter salexigens]
MQNVLVINSSINGAEGNSAKLVSRFIEKWQSEAELQINDLDLTSLALLHLTQQEMQAWMTDKDQRTPEQQTLAALSDDFIADVQWADTLVIGMPMYNFSMPSVFKAWIDRIARAGITFKYTPDGPVGLLKNKRVIVLAARGGKYAGTAKDTQTQYLNDVFAFIGIDNVDFVYAEGLAMGEESFKQNWHAAEQKNVELISQMVA